MITLGYGGFVPKIKAENMFSESFGKTTAKSFNNQCNIGADVPPQEKYVSIAKATFVDNATVKAPTVAESVGVDKGKPSYKQPLALENVCKFYGIEYKDWNESLKAKAYENTSKNFFYSNSPPKCNISEQSEDEAAKLFYGVEEKKVVKLGEPLPGYQGFNKRIVADNIYGTTYQVCKGSAKSSDMKVHDVEQEELKKTGKISLIGNIKK